MDPEELHKEGMNMITKDERLQMIDKLLRDHAESLGEKVTVQELVTKAKQTAELEMAAFGDSWPIQHAWMSLQEAAAEYRGVAMRVWADLQKARFKKAFRQWADLIILESETNYTAWCDQGGPDNLNAAYRRMMDTYAALKGRMA